MDLDKKMKQAIPCPVCAQNSKYAFSTTHNTSIYNIYKCSWCGLGFVTPLPSHLELAKFYQDQYYQGGSRLGYNSPYEDLEKGLKKTYRNIIKRVQLLSGKRTFPAVLDVGCAYGYFLDCAKNHLKSSIRIGLDLSDTLQRNVNTKGHTFKKGRFEETAFPGMSFDLIFFGDVFEHFLDPIRVMQQMNKLIRPGGSAIITTVDFSSLAAKILRKRWRLMTPPEHLFFWTPKALKTLFKKFGWYGLILPYTLYYPKEYVWKVFKKQFLFPPLFLKLLPLDTVPIPSYDVKLAIFWKGR